jgi:hypothetical protein
MGAEFVDDATAVSVGSAETQAMKRVKISMMRVFEFIMIVFECV